jgi:hypothetical protein
MWRVPSDRVEPTDMDFARRLVSVLTSINQEAPCGQLRMVRPHSLLMAS